MLPDLTTDDLADDRAGNLELRRNILLLFMTGQSADLQDLRFSQFGKVTFLSLAKAIALASVLHVVRMCSQAKMIWVHAQAIVAGVQDETTFSDVPFKQLVGETMRPNWTTGIIGQSSISGFEFCGRPFPASRGRNRIVSAKEVLSRDPSMWDKFLRIPSPIVVEFAQATSNWV